MVAGGKKSGSSLAAPLLFVRRSSGGTPEIAAQRQRRWQRMEEGDGGVRREECSYGQNLTTSTFIGETTFAILIAIVGLVLFAHLIGNMQTYLQSLTMRLEEWRLRRRDTEEWMRHRQLPEDLRKRVRRFVQYKWVATRGVHEDVILHGLPADLRRDIQRHLCLDLVPRVPFFSQMDDQLLDAICERLVSSLSTEDAYIVREGDPVTEMLTMESFNEEVK
ncbi:hypothetical protein LXL04_029275 [Taraxacum kok-saghyz]